MEAALLKTVADKMLEQIAKQNASGEQSVEEMKNMWKNLLITRIK